MRLMLSRGFIHIFRSACFVKVTNEKRRQKGGVYRLSHVENNSKVEIITII
jgi:hypothetical protein